jgi:hypothetical protein
MSAGVAITVMAWAAPPSDRQAIAAKAKVFNLIKPPSLTKRAPAGVEGREIQPAGVRAFDHALVLEIASEAPCSAVRGRQWQY